MARLPGVKPIVATYDGGASGNFTFPTVEARFNYSRKRIDSHNAVTTGVGTWVFTAPRKGSFLAIAKHYARGVNAAEISVTVYFYVNGALWSQFTGYNFNNNSSREADVVHADTVELNKGDTFYVQVVASNANTNETALNSQQISITEVL